MRSPDKQPPTQLKNEHDRTIRSASPAIKRPASDMGAQDREEHITDVEMGDTVGDAQSPPRMEASSDSKTKQEHGKRLRGEENSDDSTMVHLSDPKSASQVQSLDDSLSGATSSLIPSPSKTSTAATSISPSLYEPSISADQLPSIDEQVQKIISLAKAEPADKQKGYIVSSKWLRQVQARSTIPFEGGTNNKVDSESPIGPVDNSDIAMVIEDQGQLKDEAGEKFVELRPNLTLGEDFEVLPQEAWDLIISWYGLARTSPIITRYAHNTSEGEISNVMYELNPPIWSILKVPATHTPQTQREKDLSPQRISQSRYTQFQTWLKQAKELVGIDLSTKVRVWRILGGLKSTSASGILTPAASRSASPAPGVELIASAGDKMLLDVNTFASLPTGEHRELLDVSDHTADLKYNGKVTLATIGLGRNDVIVLEEQASKNNEWPSENLKLNINKNLSVKPKGLTVSGRSSPAPGIMTRGRQRRDGRPKGISGLSNLGNTCYMNSALQSIRSVEELTQYFLADKWKQDLNVDNPIGHHGNVARAYADLIHQIYGDNASSSFNPSRFKATVGKYGSQFAGYGQQDSQEFLLFLLDGLQEDLNRVRKKPYIEKPDSTDEMVHDAKALKEFADKNWEIYKARIDSVITDLFAGMYKSTVTCPVCDKVSIIFDGFTTFTLQLPIENTWAREILYFPLWERPYRIDVDIDKMASIRTIKEFVAKRTHHNPDQMIMAESYRHKFFKTFNNGDIIGELAPGQHDVLCIYELEDVPTNYNPNKRRKHASLLTMSRDPEDELVALDSPEADKLLIPVYHRVIRPNDKRSPRSFFGQPSCMVIDRQDSASYDRILKKLLRVASTMTTKNIFDEDDVADAEAVTPEDSDTVLMTDDGSGSDLKVASVQGDDSIVDVSMRDASQPPTADDMEVESALPRALQLGTSIPEQLRELFTIRIVATGEGIPMSYHGIDDNKEYANISERFPHPINASQHNGDAQSEVSSDEDLPDIPYNSSKPLGDSASESGGSIDQRSGNESDDSLPQTASDIVRDTRGIRNRKNRRTYGRRDRRKQQAATSHHQNVQPQPRVPRRPTKTRASTSSDLALLRPGDAVVLDWDEDVYDALFTGSELRGTDEMRGAPTWKEMELFEDVELKNKRSQRLSRRKNGVTLEDCLNEFGKEETLSEDNAWYCPRCKERRCARKRFELWKSPDILVVHFKRFASSRNFRDKLEVRVDYPVEGLDLSNMVQDQSDGKSLVYDLIAVDNHYGGLGGGHYTAYAKNFINDSWYDYNDSHVSQKDSTSVVTAAAYLLVYRRRADVSLGGPALEKILSDADDEANPVSRDASPSGEGQRLGDSSHNGLSSAYLVDQAHLVGDGGPAGTARDLSLEEGNLLTLSARTISSDALPSYGEATKDSDMLLDPDEAIDVPDLTSPWMEPSWPGFGTYQGTAGHANSIDEQDGNSSTRGQGASPNPSISSFANDDDMDDDQFMHSEDISDFNRGMREDAPPPGVPSLNVSNADEEDDDDDLPVQELRTNQSGEMQFTPATSSGLK